MKKHLVLNREFSRCHIYICIHLIVFYLYTTIFGIIMYLFISLGLVWGGPQLRPNSHKRFGPKDKFHLDLVWTRKTHCTPWLAGCNECSHTRIEDFLWIKEWVELIDFEAPNKKKRVILNEYKYMKQKTLIFNTQYYWQRVV